MKNKGTILIADSCFGGLSVIKYFQPWSSLFDIYFLADGEKNPFGVKSKEEVKAIVEDWLGYALSIQASLLVIACNTASVCIDECIDELTERYKIPIISLVQALKEMVMQKRESLQNRNILLYGTRLTIDSGIYSKILQQYGICVIPLKGTFSEHVVARGKIKDPESLKGIEHELLSQYEDQADGIVLACTCFYFLKDVVRKIYPLAEIIDLAQYIIPIAKKNLGDYSYSGNGEIFFLTTGEYYMWKNNFDILSKIMFHKKNKLLHVSIR